MFAEMRSKKKKKWKLKEKARRQAASAELPPAEVTVSEPSVDLVETDELSSINASLGINANALADDDFEGLELGEYARKYNYDRDAVWKMVRMGELIARSENGFIYVYGKTPPQQEIQLKAPSELPPLPATIPTVEPHSIQLSGESSAGAAVALLMDHLTLAREEQRNLLIISQESIDRISKMSESIVSLKDNLLVEKDKLLSSQGEQIKGLESRLAQERDQTRKLQQKIEDMDMLARSLIADKK